MRKSGETVYAFTEKEWAKVLGPRDVEEMPEDEVESHVAYDPVVDKALSILGRGSFRAEAVILRFGIFGEGPFSFKEIAQRQGCSETTARKRFQMALDLIGQRIPKEIERALHP